jgi:hypothetical protein
LIEATRSYVEQGRSSETTRRFPCSEKTWAGPAVYPTKRNRA